MDKMIVSIFSMLTEETGEATLITMQPRMVSLTVV